jgi:hypothetical protein
MRYDSDYALQFEWVVGKTIKEVLTAVKDGSVCVAVAEEEIDFRTNNKCPNGIFEC